ncbi:hypothetical protein MKX01_030820, partial [Papaver californicum]
SEHPKTAAAAMMNLKRKSPTVTESDNSVNSIGAPKIQGNLKGCSVGQLKSFLGSLNDGTSSPQDVMNAPVGALFGGVVVVDKGFSNGFPITRN